MLQVSAASANDIWAVGFHLTVFGFTQPYQTSAFHYDGNGWTAVATPNVNKNPNYLFDVVSLGPTDAWAVGLYDTGHELFTMTQHWNGVNWSIVPSPNPKPATDELYGVAAVTPSDIWAVGRTSDGLVTVDTLVERFTSVCSSSSMHVADITPFTVASQRASQVGADITIVDSGGVGVANANVTIRVTAPGGRISQYTRVTGSTGKTKLTLSTSQKGTYTFTVVNVALSGWTYDAAANVETTDSITVN
jgi:hypothetical protein